MTQVHRFGRFELSLAERSLRSDGVPVPLGGRAFDLLLALIERAGQLVGKDELLDAVWGRTIVEEGNLHVQVSSLRKLLGAAAIETIPGRGYRFMPPQPLQLARPSVIASIAAAVPPKPSGPALIGRDADLAGVQALIDAHRLVTITGPGGIGKTSLARAALAAHAHPDADLADRHPDGVLIVELAMLTDGALIPGAIAAAAQMPLAAALDPLAALCAGLLPLRALLLLDNAEHLVERVAAVAEALLQAAPSLKLVVTSQAPLKLAGEQVFRLGGLALPSEVDDVNQALHRGALALLNERVVAADRHFALSAANLAPAVSICRQLDGIALAIELAAARVPLLGLQGVAERLDERLKLLRSNIRSAPTRHQTLQAAMDWSHALLTEAQAVAFRQLGVFVGGFSLGTAAQVLQVPGLDEWAGIDLLSDLVDRSLVTVDAQRDGVSSTPRYRLLETGRAYARDRLQAAGDIDAVRQRHALALRDAFEQVCDDGWLLPEAQFLALHEVELDNLRAALDWALAHDAVSAVALAGASTRLWRALSLHPEALRRFGQACALIDDETPLPLAARLWEGVARLSGEIASADSRSAAQRAGALYRQSGDRRGQYLALAHVAFSYRTTTPEAEAAFAEMQVLEDPSWPPALLLYGRKVEGGLASDAGRLEAARAAHEGRLALGTAAGSERDVNAALGNLADLALMSGDADSAVRLGRELLTRLGRRHLATRGIALGNLLLALLALGATGEARDVQAEFVDVVRQLDHMYVVYTADAMAWLAALEARWDAAARLLGYADATYAAEGQAREPNEARARTAALALLQARGDPALLSAGMAAGAALSAAEVCRLAVA